MSEFWNNAGKNFNAYKMAWIRTFLYAYIVGFTTLQTSLNGLELSAFNPTQKWMLFGGVIAAMVGTVIAFMDKTLLKTDTKDLPKEPDLPTLPQTPQKP